MPRDGEPRAASAWPGLTAWRGGRRLRAVTHASCVLAPLALLAALVPRTVQRLQTPRADEMLAASVLVALPLLGWFGARLDTAWMRQPQPDRSPWSRVTQLLWRSPLTRSGAVFGAILVIVALLAPVLAPYDPLAFAKIGLQAPTATHWLGTDAIGRDVLSRLLYGARISLAVGVVTVALSMVLGTLVGLVAGYVGGVVDASLMRLVDLLLAFPRIFLVLLIIALWGPSIWLVVVVLGLTGWMPTARLVRAQVLSVRESEYVQAARVSGAPMWRVLIVHILPNTLAPVLVSATLMIGNTILAESTLSFLGLGVQVPTPSWGAMLNEARASWRAAWWLATFPGTAITITVVACNLVGDGLRDLVDPRSRARHEV